MLRANAAAALGSFDGVCGVGGRCPEPLTQLCVDLGLDDRRLSRLKIAQRALCVGRYEADSFSDLPKVAVLDRAVSHDRTENPALIVREGWIGRHGASSVHGPSAHRTR
jgi:hypothetical protein